MSAGDNKIPMNIYLTRQEKSALKAEARDTEVTMMDLIRKGVTYVLGLRRRAGRPMPRPAPIHRTAWRERIRKTQAQKAAKAKARAKKAA